jgi:hypothetical protein
MYSFKRDEIVILLGAGASVEAGIPHSEKMISEVESLVASDPNWGKYRDLYNYIRSSIYHSDGIRGKFDRDVTYNIERLVNTLDEIAKKREHTLYPFVGAWDPTLVEVAGRDFELIVKFRNEILRMLRGQWLTVQDYATSAGYFQKLVEFQQDYGHPLRVFTLNYDLCVERSCAELRLGSEVRIERGFKKETRKWDWRQFIENPDEPNIYLYKLHGSTDWSYDQDDELTFFDDPARIADDKAAMIFGTSYKLEYRDPFLFLAYMFRQWTLEARIIVSIGYGFGDEHINKIIHEALKRDKQRILLSISPLNQTSQDTTNRSFVELAEGNNKRSEIAKAIGCRNHDQIKCHSQTAREFMTHNLQIEYLANLLPSSGELFPIISTG